MSKATVVCPVCEQQFISGSRAERMGWVNSHTCLTPAERKEKELRDLTRRSGELAQLVAEHARETIGPEGKVLKVSGSDASLARATFIARLAEAATKLANGEKLT